MDLVLSGRVTESALLALSTDILNERGVLPVGEIGKSLQDIAPTRNLSGKVPQIQPWPFHQHSSHYTHPLILPSQSTLSPHPPIQPTLSTHQTPYHHRSRRSTAV